MPTSDIYTKLIDLLDSHGVRYQLIDHPPEGRTHLASKLRGHALPQAAKCMVVEVEFAGRGSEYILAVVPGHTRVDLEAVRAMRGGSHAVLAPRAIAERMAGSVSGSIVPFSFHDNLRLVADPSLASAEKLYFNAGRLDRSVAIRASDYFSLAGPCIESVAMPSGDVAAADQRSLLEEAGKRRPGGIRVTATSSACHRAST
jgi:Ala-tRNA(Pro) deacylase